MFVDKPFLADPRVSKEAFKLADNGYKVSVLALSPHGNLGREVVRGITVYTMPMINLFKKSTRSTSRLGVLFYRALSAFGYIVEYFYFALVCLFIFPMVAVRDGFQVIHSSNPPNILCLLSLGYRLLGKKVIFDHHDLEPELYLSRYRVRRNFIYRILHGIEALVIRHSDLVIATNESYRAIEMERGGIGPEKIFIVRNGPARFEFQRDSREPGPQMGGRKLLVYIGTMGPQDGLDYMLHALHHLRYGLGREDFQCIAIGQGDVLEDMKGLVKDLRLEESVRFTGLIPRQELLHYLAAADICLDPNPSNPLNDHSTWIKVMEYMMYSKPIVSFDLKETRFTARDAALYVKPNDVEEYAKAVARLMDDPACRSTMGERGYARVERELAWEIVSENLLTAYNWLLEKRESGATSSGRKLARRFYYFMKPLIPRSAQIAVRRMFARRVARNVDIVWPIDPRSQSRPLHWKGWPDGKKFALVLTHDVEGLRGVERCAHVAAMEKELGFVSSFNFVPERYEDDPRVRTELTAQGFEIGVHDLSHDGKLYQSRRIFTSRAARINAYLREWGAVGFRSAAMQHNLEWLKDLAIEYDASTFDTDPFEPQPDGIGTIFPLWVANGSSGYVELPYTLPQDSTLFVVLQHHDARVWREKLDWVAEKGGMALLNTHPDYMLLNGERRQIDEYPHTWYRDFLFYLRERYTGLYWNALPRDVARFWRELAMAGSDDSGERREALHDRIRTGNE